MNFSNDCDGVNNSLDIRLTKKCDNNCSFCIDKIGLNSLGKTDIQKIHNSVKNSGIKNVLILGGEPFIEMDKLYELTELLKDTVNELYITTALPIQITNNFQLFKKIMNNINGLNVSIQDADWKVNNDILNASVNHNRIQLLERILTDYGDKTRVSVNLIKKGIDSRLKYLNTLDILSNLGVKHLKVNELQHSSDYVSYEIMMKIKLPSPFYSGCSTKIKKHKDMEILLKRSCFIVEKTNHASILDIAKIFIKFFKKVKGHFAVVYENGQLYNQWKIRSNDENKTS